MINKVRDVCRQTLFREFTERDDLAPLVSPKFCMWFHIYKGEQAKADIVKKRLRQTTALKLLRLPTSRWALEISRNYSRSPDYRYLEKMVL